MVIPNGCSKKSRKNANYVVILTSVRTKKWHQQLHDQYKTHSFLPYKGERWWRIVKSINKEKCKILPQKRVTQNICKNSKFNSYFNIKGSTKLEHNVWSKSQWNILRENRQKVRTKSPSSYWKRLTIQHG